ncbi:MAG: hypothetical protein PHP23_05730 [Desulfobacterales bacterium]|nr:hypothetical protein [Desulfobacterales bacterium]MDD4071408.1 hypothetical protein [Desulfobacterales bacterium]MDD4391453.1 hypothetical protein [Desulfobacterales bacterium]
MENLQLLDQLAQELPICFTRKNVCSHLGGLMAPGTLANLDSKGLGCSGRKLIGGKVVYSKAEFLKWLESRMFNKN